MIEVMFDDVAVDRAVNLVYHETSDDFLGFKEGGGLWNARIISYNDEIINGLPARYCSSMNQARGK